MAAAARKTDNELDEHYVEFQVDLGKLKYQMEAISEQGKRQEKKIDDVKFALDKMSSVTTREFIDYKDAVNARFESMDSRYIRVDSVKGLRQVAYAVLTALAVAFAIAIVKLLGPNL